MTGPKLAVFRNINLQQPGHESHKVRVLIQDMGAYRAIDVNYFLQALPS